MIPPTDKQSSWPDLAWEIPPGDAVAWFHQRVQVVAQRTRAFELAMAQAAEKGEVELAFFEEPLSMWDGRAETVFMYAGLCRDGEVEADAVPVFVEELAPVYAELAALREAVYGELGDKAARLRQAEAATKVTAEQIEERIEVLDAEAGAEPDADEEGDFVNDDDADEAEEGGTEGDEASGAASDAKAGSDDLGFDAPSMPISVDELRMRQAAESKLLPAKLELVDLLAHLPSEWVIAIFGTLDAVEEEEPSIRSPKATRYRAQLAEILRDRDTVEAILDCIGEEACLLLKNVIAKKGMLDYQGVLAKYGADDADGYFWSERPPASALSRLRRTGLVYVGGFQGRPVVVVPTDLIPVLTPLLARAG